MQAAAEKVKPYRDDTRDKAEQVRDMFNNIAPAYDFMNRAMTFGIDRRWRRKAVDMLGHSNPIDILDVATGTGDLALLIARRLPDTRVTGVDLSEKMVEIGRKKVSEAGLTERIKLETGDCLQLPYGTGSFDAVTVAYGVRNYSNLSAGLKEMHRVTRPGGTVCIIELSTPTSKLVKPLYHLYTRTLIPLAGRLVSKDVRAYSYLPESIAAVPQGKEMCRFITEAGYTDARFKRLTFGTCTIYTAVKPKIQQ